MFKMKKWKQLIKNKCVSKLLETINEGRNSDKT